MPNKQNIYEIKPVESLNLKNSHLKISDLYSQDQLNEAYKAGKWKFKWRGNMSLIPIKAGFKQKKRAVSHSRLKRKLNKTMKDFNFEGLLINSPYIYRRKDTNTSNNYHAKSFKEFGDNQNSYHYNSPHENNENERKIMDKNCWIKLSSSHKRNIKIVIRTCLESA